MNTNLPDIQGIPCLAGNASAAAVLCALRDGIRDVFGERLIGMYLYGSLVRGDFDPDISDLDTMASVTGAVTEADVTALRRMHDALVDPAVHPELGCWADRIETQYVPIAELPRFWEKPFLMANISPGEPIHRVEAGREWLVNWFFVQTEGVRLYGLPPAEGARTDPMLTHGDFLVAILDHARTWREYVAETAGSIGYQAYAVLTLCRALYTMTQGRQVSKRAAADWAMQTVPMHAGLIRAALSWREGAGGAPDPGQSYPRVEAFVRDMIDRIEAQRICGHSLEEGQKRIL